MIDSFERHALADILIRLTHEESDWDELDAFLTKNPTPFHDNAILNVGYAFWEIFDPEWPCNLMNLKPDLVFRTLLFLYSTQEYVEPEDPRGWWLKILDFIHRSVFLFLGILSSLIVGFFLGFFYGLLFGVLYCIILGWGHDMFLNRARSYKADSSPSNEETTDFWPFASIEAYQEENKRNGERIQALVKAS